MGPLLGLSICHAPWPKFNPIVHPTSYPTHTPFIPSESTLPFLRYSNLNILPSKSKVKVMGEVKSLKSQCESNILSTHILFVASQSVIPFLRYNFFKIWPWKSKVKVLGEVKVWSHNVSQTFYRLTSFFVPCQSAIPFLRYNFLKFWPWKSKIKVMGEGKVENHNMGPTFYRLTSLSFHVNRPSHSWDKTFSKFDLENPRSRSGLRSKLEVTKWV